MGQRPPLRRRKHDSNLLYLSALRNERLNIKQLRLAAIGDSQLIQRFLSHCKNLKVLILPHIPSSEAAWALAAGLCHHRHLGHALKEVWIDFLVEGDLRPLVASLIGHPYLERFNYQRVIINEEHEIPVDDMLLLGATCPNLKYLEVALGEYEVYDAAPKLFASGFSSSLETLHLGACRCATRVLCSRSLPISRFETSR